VTFAAPALAGNALVGVDLTGCYPGEGRHWRHALNNILSCKKA
jgi:hypothetical protein